MRLWTAHRISRARSRRPPPVRSARIDPALNPLWDVQVDERSASFEIQDGLTIDEGGGPQVLATVPGIYVVSVETVRTHVRNVIRKLQARNRVHAIAIALERGEIQLESPDGA